VRGPGQSAKGPARHAGASAGAAVTTGGDAGPEERGAEEHSLLFSPEGLDSFRRLIIAARVDMCVRLCVPGRC
jgi:hypothetical protein